MPADPRLLALPSLRRQAEADARELFDRGHAVAQSFGFESPMWELLREDERTAVIENHARGLADPTRWQSQAWALRRIGALVWREEPDYVPALNQAELELERGKHTVCWVLGGKCYGHPLWNDSHIPGIGRMSRPEAIAAILLHLESQ